jgi:8-oxo-dGTP pyrophosphatase MutT (NUDIX family)
MSWNEETLRAALARPNVTVAEWEALPAAVLIPLFKTADGEWRVVLTQRTNEVETHKGQVSFPGGRVDEGDADRVATALREAREEIGLDPQQVEVIGVLDELLTVTQYRVTPVVGVIPWSLTFSPSKEEVSDVFSVPLGWLGDPANLEVRYRTPPLSDREIPVYYYREYEGKIIWGATARILLDLLARLGLRLPL